VAKDEEKLVHELEALRKELVKVKKAADAAQGESLFVQFSL
jgi:hypothetical protein